MADAQVTVKVSPRQFELILDSLINYYDENKDLVDDPAVKQEDKQIPAQEMFEASAIIREWGYSHRIDR